MEFEIYKRLELQAIVQNTEKMDLVLAIEQNPYLSIVQICDSKKYPGIFLIATIDICIPTNGVYKGLDVKDKEEIVLYIPTNYPFSAPSVIPARDDFPTNLIPHLNTSVSGTEIRELNLCLYRGDVNEWFFQQGVFAFCDRVVEWFSDLVNGELIHNDGFENVRITDQRDVLLVDYKAMTNYIKSSRDNQGFEIFSIKGDGFYGELTTQKFDYLKRTNKNIPCVFAFDRIMPETDYIVNQFNTFSDIEIFNSATQVKKGIRRYRAQSLKYIKNAKKIPKAIMVVMAIKRPMQVLGTFDKFDYIAFLLDFDFESNPAEFGNSTVYNYATVGLVNKELAEKISGTEFEKPDISIIGVGAIGSKVSMHLAKMGYINQKIYDNDCLLPHNLIRHEEKYPIMIGAPKAFVAQGNIKALFRDEAKCSIGKVDILADDVELYDKIIVDATASERCLNFLCSKEMITGCVVRTEIFTGGIVGATFVEGSKRNPDIYDLRVSLWHKAIESQDVRNWLFASEQEENRELYIGIGCSSDTFVLDDATISNHASVVPHIVNKYVGCDNGTIVLNYFNKGSLIDNHIQLYEIEAFEKFEINDWCIHIKKDVWNNVKIYLDDSIENMGIWLGTINFYLKRIVIIDTYIPSDNKRTTGEVIAGTQGVDELINKYEEVTNGLIGYVGEWHTHTGDSASPSSKDLVAFSQVEQGRITLMTILGRKEVKNFILDKR
ncbi:MAG: Mov34/MPN/PAD-1 family protein [Clostridia bacterium]|nr:Mov34/MPN/PAD-1 family protein [Clostridia bacterium]